MPVANSRQRAFFHAAFGLRIQFFTLSLYQQNLKKQSPHNEDDPQNYIYYSPF